MKTKLLFKLKIVLCCVMVGIMSITNVLGINATVTSHSVSVKLKNGYTLKPSYSYSSTMAKSEVAVTNGSPIGLSCSIVYDEYTKTGKSIYTAKTVSTVYKSCSSTSKKVDVSSISHVLHNVNCISYTNSSSSSVNINNKYFTGIIIGSGRFSSVLLNKK